VAAAVAASACAGGWRRPGTGAPAAPTALDALTPYLLPTRGVLVAFTCRWDPSLPLGVSLPPDASPEEQALLESALRAWEGTGIGVRFVPVPRHQAAIDVSFIASTGTEANVPGTEFAGQTLADCRVRGGEEAWRTADRLDAELVLASIRLMRRSPKDWRGHDRPLSPEELVGAMLHELGHALGYQGHVRGVRGVMGVEREIVARVGRRVLAGEGLGASAVKRLYALPSGTVLRRSPVSAVRTEPADALAALGAARGLAGPFARVGDREARIFWVEPGGSELGVQVPEPARTLGAAERLVVLVEPKARSALRGGSDGAPEPRGRAPGPGSGAPAAP